MRRMIPIVASLFAVATQACVSARQGRSSEMAETSSERTPRQTILEAFALFTDSGRVPANIILTELKRLDGKTRPPDGPIVSALTPLVAKLVDSPAELGQDDLKKVIQQMSKLGALDARDYPTQLAVTTGLFRLESRLSGGNDLDGDVAEPGNAAVTRAENLVTSFPAKAEAHAHLGHVREALGSDTLDTLRSYGRCMELSPGFSDCRLRFATLAAEYERPRCTRFKPQGLTLHQAHLKAGKATKAVDLAGVRAHMETKAAINGAQVQDIHEQKNPDDTITARVELTPLAAARFAELTAALAQKSGYLAIFVGGKLHALPRVMSTIDSGQIALSFPRELPWSTLCETFESRKLPAELQRFKPLGS